MCVFWGGNFVAAKFSLYHFPPFFLTTLRFFLTALLLAPFVPKLARAQMMPVFQIATLNTLHFSLPFVAMAMGLSIASTSVTTQLGVPFSCLIGALFFHDRLGPWRTLGMVTSFGGMVIVFGAPEIAGHQTAFFCALVAAFFWGLTNILMKYIKGVGMFQMLAWMSLFSTPQLLILSLIFEPGAWQTLLDVPLNAALGIAYTVIFSTLGAYGLWFWLLQRHPISLVTPYSLLTPIIGTVLAQVFFQEALSVDVLIGGAVTIAGVAVIVIRRPKLAKFSEPI